MEYSLQALYAWRFHTSCTYDGNGLSECEPCQSFGLQYVVIRKPKPMDTATLNYSWQMNGTNAFRYIRTAQIWLMKVCKTGSIVSVKISYENGNIKYNNHSGYIASVINEYDLSAVKTYDAGFTKA